MRIEDLTLDWLLARVVERDGCLIWAGHTGGGGKVPQTRIDKKFYSVNRLIWELSRGKPVPKGLRVGPACGNDGCIHPDCLTARKPGTLLKGRKLPADTKVKITQARRVSSALTQEAVRQMRLDDRPAGVLAAEAGVHVSYVHRIKAGEARVEYADPFAGLMRMAA